MDRTDWVIGAAIAGMICVLGFLAYQEIAHPCLRHERRWSNWTVIGWDSKSRPVYGPGYDDVCVERQP